MAKGSLLGKASKNVRDRGIKPFTKRFGKAVRAEIKRLQKGKSKRKSKGKRKKNPRHK